METVKGRVSNIHRDVSVADDSRMTGGHSSGSTTDITNFEIAGRSMQYRSGKATYNSIGEGDQLVVAGESQGSVFRVIAFRNLTKNLNSYKSAGISPFRLLAIVLLILGIGLAALLLLVRASLVLLSISIPMILAAGYLLYIDQKHRMAVSLIEESS